MFAPRIDSHALDSSNKVSHEYESPPLRCSAPGHEEWKASLERTVSVVETDTIIQAYLSCGAKDYFLVFQKSNDLVGIITSTDIVYRVIARGLDPHFTIVSQIMTRNLVVARNSIDASNALMLMVSHKIKHLPILNQEGDVVDVLHLTDVFNEYLEDACRKLNTSEHLNKPDAILAARTTAGELVQKSSIPNFNAVVDSQGPPIYVSPKDSIYQVARILKDKGASAVCIVDDFTPTDEDSASRQILGLCAPENIAFYYLLFGTFALKSSIIRVMKKSSILRVQPSTSFYEVASKMIKGRFSNTLVETTSSVSSIVNMLAMSTALVTFSQGDIRRTISTRSVGPRLFPTNYFSLEISRKGTPIKGDYKVDPYLRIPAELLHQVRGHAKEEGTRNRKNLRFEVENGKIDVNIFLVGQPAENDKGMPSQTTLDMKIKGSDGTTFPLIAKIHTPDLPRRAFYLNASGIDGYHAIHMPPSLHGLVTITVVAGDLDSHISLSQEFSANAIILNETSTARSYFIGELGEWSRDKQGWEGDRVVVSVVRGLVRLQFLGEKDKDRLRRVMWKFGF